MISVSFERNSSNGLGWVGLSGRRNQGKIYTRVCMCVARADLA